MSVHNSWGFSYLKSSDPVNSVYAAGFDGLLLVALTTASEKLQAGLGEP